MYKLKNEQMLCGVLAGISEKYKLNLELCRHICALTFFLTFGLVGIIYVILAVFLPYNDKIKDDDEDYEIEEKHNTSVDQSNKMTTADAKFTSVEDGWYW